MPEPRWYLHFAWGRAPYVLDLPEVVIGRGEACPLQIDEPAAGEEHARIILDEGELVWLEDLGSGSPTLQNGRPVRGKVQLQEGDFVQIGHSVLTLRGADASRRAPTSAAPDARTMTARDLPPEVKQVLAARDTGAAKNFVVGQHEAGSHEVGPLATLMMESPLFVPEGGRVAQRTVEVNVDDMMAAIRKNAQAAAPEAPAPAQPSGTTLHSVRAPTMLGIGPKELASAPTMIGASPRDMLASASSPTRRSTAWKD